MNKQKDKLKKWELQWMANAIVHSLEVIITNERRQVFCSFVFVCLFFFFVAVCYHV